MPELRLSARSFPLTLVLGAAMTVIAGCGSDTPSAESPSEAAGDSGSRSRSHGIDTSAEVGALDEAQVKSAFNASIGPMTKCFEKGAERVAFLSGAIRISVRVPASGKARAFMKSSTLGSREAERCMLDAVEARSWPAPVGGKVGIAENEFTFDPAEGVRQAVSWSPSDAGKNVDKVVAALASCRQKASGSGKLSATLYVETDGTVKSVGVAGDDPSAESAADCVVSAMRDIKLNSPGSFAAKVTFSE